MYLFSKYTMRICYLLESTIENTEQVEKVKKKKIHVHISTLDKMWYELPWAQFLYKAL